MEIQNRRNRLHFDTVQINLQVPLNRLESQ